MNRRNEEGAVTRLPVPSILATAVSILAAVPASSADVADRPDISHTKSKRVEISGPWPATATHMRAGPWEQVPSDVHPRLLLQVRNQSHYLYFIRVRMTGPTPNQSCDEDLGVVLPREFVELSCPQDSLHLDVDYPLEVFVFEDPARSDTLEMISTRFRLSRDFLKKQDKLIASRQQELAEDVWPKTFGKLYYKEVRGDAGSKEAFASKVRGTLTVKPDGLEYVTDSRTFTVPAGNLRGMTYDRLPGKWVTVDYEDAGASKVLSLITGRFGNPLIMEKMSASIEALINGTSRTLSRADAAPQQDSDSTVAGWPDDPLVNVEVGGDAGDQEGLKMVSDGAGGALFVWSNGPDGTQDIYAQHILADGTQDSKWPAAGRAVCAVESTQVNPGLVTDGSGGAIVSWVDRRGGVSNLHAQHVLANGDLDGAWPVAGLVLSGAAKYLFSPRLLSDGAGGALVVWVATAGGTEPSQIHLRRVLANGSLDPAWPGADQAVRSVPAGKKSDLLAVRGLAPLVVADGAGGAIVAWREGGIIFAKRVRANGTADPAWPAAGVRLCDGVAGPAWPEMVADGAGGAIVAWEAEPSKRPLGGRQIHAHHLLPNGVVDPAWPAQGRALSAGPGFCGSPKIVGDGAGGAIVAWADAGNLFAQHVLANGALDPDWISTGRRLCLAKDTQRSHAIASDGAGGAIVTWEDGRGGRATILFGNGDIYAQHMQANGSLDPAWPPAGSAVCVVSDNQHSPAVVADGAGGAIITWLDRRANATVDRAFAQRVGPDGRIGGTVVVRP